jgi:hypothetical protein
MSASQAQNYLRVIEDWIEEAPTARIDPTTRPNLTERERSCFERFRRYVDVEAALIWTAKANIVQLSDEQPNGTVIAIFNEPYDYMFNTTCAIALAQVLLDLDDNDGVFVMTWASWYSKPAVGEFVGGMHVFNRYHDVWETTTEEMERRLRTELAALHSATRPKQDNK